MTEPPKKDRPSKHSEARGQTRKARGLSEGAHRQSAATRADTGRTAPSTGGPGQSLMAVAPEPQAPPWPTGGPRSPRACCDTRGGKGARAAVTGLGSSRPGLGSWGRGPGLFEQDEPDRPAAAPSGLRA